MYKSPLLFDFEKNSISSFIDFVVTVYKITELLIGHSLTLADTHLKPCKRRILAKIKQNLFYLGQNGT